MGDILATVLLLIFVFYIVSFNIREIREQKKKEIAQEEQQRQKEEQKKRKEELRRKTIEEAAQKLEREKQEAAERRSAEESAGRVGNRERVVGNVRKLSRVLTQKTASAKNMLDSAERNFTEGVFAPFWDNVESVVRHLALFDVSSQQFAKFCEEYTRLRWHGGSIPEYASMPPIGNELEQADKAKNAALDVADMLNTMVRNAQKNFQFAMIYEQRKTNQLLEIGFDNLDQALKQIDQRIERSTRGLAEVIVASTSVSTTILRDAIQENTQTVRESSEINELAIDSSTRATTSLANEGNQTLIAQMESDSKARLAQTESDSRARGAHEKEERKILSDIRDKKVLDS